MLQCLQQCPQSTMQCTGSAKQCLPAHRQEHKSELHGFSLPNAGSLDAEHPILTKHDATNCSQFALEHPGVGCLPGRSSEDASQTGAVKTQARQAVLLQGPRCTALSCCCAA